MGTISYKLLEWNKKIKIQCCGYTTELLYRDLYKILKAFDTVLEHKKDSNYIMYGSDIYLSCEIMKIDSRKVV